MTIQLRPADTADYSDLSRFINEPCHLHRHLDWRDALTWLGRHPFWIGEEDGKIVGTLACPPEPPEVAWVRLYASSLRASTDRVWKALFERCLADLDQIPVKPVVTSLAMRDWYEELLQRQGFQHHQDIVVFLYDEQPPKAPILEPGFRLREMHPGDLQAVARIDQQSFEPIWRLSLDDLTYAADRSAYCTLMEYEGSIVAYQMSSSSGMYAHLSRLAVRPDLQGHRLGFALVQNLLDYFITGLSYWGVTLNTQHNNLSSLALYQRIGFRETGERFPVYVYPR